MNKPSKLIVDLAKPVGERETVIELTDEEVLQLEAMALKAQAQREADKQAAAEKESQKQSAKDKLAALGLTPEEIAAITGS